MAAARGILLKCNRSMLAEFGGPVQLSRTWAHSLLKQMKFVQRKATTSKSKHIVQNFAHLKEAFLADVTATVTMEEVPNSSSTGIKQASNLSQTRLGRWQDMGRRGWSWLVLVINGRLLQSSVAVCLEIFY